MQSDSIADSRKLTILPGTKHLILCEGKDDKAFLMSFLKSGFLNQFDLNFIQVTKADGVDNIRKMVLVLVNTDGFQQIDSLLVIRDADNDIRSAQDSVKGAFAAAGLPVPQTEYQWERGDTIKTAFLLMPTCSNTSQKGALDDLCWDILSEKFEDSIKEEVNGFISSLEADKKRTYVHKSKALVHTYFSATEKLIASGIGRAADAGAFDWTSEILDPLRYFLKSMIL